MNKFTEEMLKKNCLVIPRPKYCQFYAGYFCLTENTLILLGKDAKIIENESKILQDKIRHTTGIQVRITNEITGRYNHKIVLKLSPKGTNTVMEEEGYFIRVKTNLVELIATTDKGIFYSIQTFIDLIEKKNNKYQISLCEIRDWPDFSWRGFLIDPARKFIPLSELKRFVEIMAQNKYNILHIHFSDAESFTLPAKAYPELKKNTQKGDFGVYTKQEIKDIVSYAEKFKIKIIPEIDIPGHSTHILKSLPQLKCQPIEGKVSEWALCIGSEKTYQFLDKLFGEIAPLFSSDVFHIGTDELEFKDRIDTVFTSWKNCRICQGRMRKENLKNTRELFYYFINKTQKILNKYGKRLMMWNDNIDISKPCNLPRDILIHFWRIAGRGRGPQKGCSLSKFLRQGFQIINSFYPETYIDGYIRENKLAHWNPTTNPQSPISLKNQIMGGEMCAWNDPKTPHDFYNWVLPSALPMFADRVWNKKEIKDLKVFARILPKHIFGPEASGKLENLFERLGSIIPPESSEKLAYIENIQKQKLKDYDELEVSLKNLQDNNKILNPTALQEYIKIIQWIRKNL